MRNTFPFDIFMLEILIYLNENELTIVFEVTLLASSFIHIDIIHKKLQKEKDEFFSKIQQTNGIKSFDACS